MDAGAGTSLRGDPDGVVPDFSEGGSLVIGVSCR
jgi:hypothetical protein